LPFFLSQSPSSSFPLPGSSLWHILIVFLLPRNLRIGFFCHSDFDYPHPYSSASLFGLRYSCVSNTPLAHSRSSRPRSVFFVGTDRFIFGLPPDPFSHFRVLVGVCLSNPPIAFPVEGQIAIARPIHVSCFFLRFSSFSPPIV